MLILKSLLTLVGAAFLLGRFVKGAKHTRLHIDDTYAHKLVEEMPLYGVIDPGYPYPGYAEVKRTAEAEREAFIQSHLTYPKLSKKHSGPQTALVACNIETDGRMTGIHVLRDPGHGYGRAAETTVRKLAREGAHWRPGYENGEAVKVQVNLPVRFPARSRP
ncbi:energy transducer TonB [Lewinella sp. IMCC34191]|uniref:energy transducer TonB n=1 Tax=Lewinella sp. IMCC34191 TaxID=2259172 RepID=UPI0013001EB8|nr:energy transducer TonB [Lewinella sp. IMCC34191]